MSVNAFCLPCIWSRNLFWQVTVLHPLLGFPWILGFFQFRGIDDTLNTISVYVGTLLMSLQVRLGIFIFFHLVLSQRILHLTYFSVVYFRAFSYFSSIVSGTHTSKLHLPSTCLVVSASSRLVPNLGCVTYYFNVFIINVKAIVIENFFSEQLCYKCCYSPCQRRCVYYEYS